MSRSRRNELAAMQEARTSADLIDARHAWREAAAKINSGQNLQVWNTTYLVAQAEVLLAAANALRAAERAEMSRSPESR
jgi:hypothetical protein